ncbi:MFS transporter [Pantoea sp. EABMAA-21]|uniref:MFS transporter n=1 Tax=Pantoea sp. EABMAA-21 TaxID=3043302 RepID=UPI0024B52FA1|nr:MFS transporter [Pantoea sp. EABMAA-21]MDI9277941.1 MFS transporter [Pantoea sp. EABMAA-21]
MDLQQKLRGKWAIYGLMFLPGFTWASWVSRTPYMRDILHASTEMMGMILFGFSCGSMLCVLLAGKLITHFGTSRVMRYGFVLLLSGVAVMLAALLLHSAYGVFASLVLLGGGTALIDVVINVEGAAFERLIGKSIMTTIHGFFSFGTLIGALSGLAMTAVDVSITWHFAFVVLANLLIVSAALRHLPATSDSERHEQAHSGGFLAQVGRELRDRQLLILGVVILAMALAEGSANDWLPLLMIDGHNLNHTQSTLVYAGFTAGMTVGRFLGGYVVDRLGRVLVLRASAFSAALGLAMVIFSNNQWLAAAAVLFWGIGASLGFPLTVSAAGDGKNSAIRVTIAATLGYLAFLVGPPGLGFIGEHAGLRMAMLPVLVMVLLALVCAGAAGSRDVNKADQPV